MGDVKITVRENGPLRVEGDVTLCDSSGREYGLGGRPAISLCRCGHSANKPFCDGSHKKVGFACAPKARDLPPPAPPGGKP